MEMHAQGHSSLQDPASGILCYRRLSHEAQYAAKSRDRWVTFNLENHMLAVSQALDLDLDRLSPSQLLFTLDAISIPA
jgi:hypothetical protein